MFSTEETAALNKITVDGITYLGFLTKNKDGISISKAIKMPKGGVLTSQVAGNFLKANKVKCTIDRNFVGTTLAYATDELNEIEKAALETAVSMMKRAESEAVPELVTKQFDKVASGDNSSSAEYSMDFGGGSS